MITNSIKITNKGQVTLPKEVRKILQSSIIVFEILDDKVMIKPVRNMAGSLKRFNKNLGSFSKIREKAWNEAVNEHHKA